MVNKDKEDKILEELSEIKAQLEILKIEYPQIRSDLTHITERISLMSDRLTVVEKDAESAHEKIQEFKKSILWTISVSITACGTLVGAITLIIQRILT